MLSIWYDYPFLIKVIDYMYSLRQFWRDNDWLIYNIISYKSDGLGVPKTWFIKKVGLLYRYLLFLKMRSSEKKERS